ncbi:twin-arginine translocation signal domain-containing protein [Sulfitobacter sp. JBTF-M27]|jgi:hypothetical protein|uniref:Twin-arginine translocation signal domain-containing protein n=1 Tax=Sulfitobacter sediminilitoris TaxID=2698830 RepID=A0A6P0CBU3_9RHOB|nr:twin-arginine translocation signal domain-containing protein [Sulfitobacter sediminilitoris]NEK23367.1 twin-arginine translocation signal domain-containing protein [Sulfitobacter sediminilitoris]
MKKEKDGANRRDFLKMAATTAPAAAVALTAAGTAEAQPVDLTSEKMQDTAHTRAYLESARF